MNPTLLGWGGVIRLGLVQTALGAVVVLTTSTLNRVMVVELALPALLPGLLVALHYAVQITRPRMGHGSDEGGRRTPWILGGMAGLCVGGDDESTRPAAVDGFRVALSEVWAEPAARHFTIFVFMSMLAYSSQDLILEPFAGLVFGLTPGESTALSGIQHGGVLGGMLLVAACTGWGPKWMRNLGAW